MSRWLITAETQLELPLDITHLYYPTLVREVNFKDIINRLKGKNIVYIQKVLYDYINDVPNNKISDRFYDVIEDDFIEGAFKKFIKMYADDDYKVYDVTISEVEKNNHNIIKDDTDKRYLICPLVSQTKLYDVSEFDTLIKALAIKLFYILNPSK